MFEAIITDTGKVEGLKTLRAPQLKPPCPEWEQAYRDAILSWEYEPAHLHGKPVAVYLTVTVTIDLR